MVYLLEEQQVLQQLLLNDKVGALKLIRSRLTPAGIFKYDADVVFHSTFPSYST